MGALDIALTADELEQLSVLRAAGDRYTDMSFVQVTPGSAHHNRARGVQPGKRAEVQGRHELGGRCQYSMFASDIARPRL